jgi:hypothetical protein
VQQAEGRGAQQQVYHKHDHVDGVRIGFVDGGRVAALVGKQL